MCCTGTKGRLITPEAVLSSPSVTVTWSNVTLWQVALDVALSNIWFFASRVLPLYTARHMNATGMFDKPLPPLGEEDILFSQLVNGRRRHRKEWHQNVLAVATGGRTKMEYAREPWAAQWSPTNQLCFRNAVFTGAFAYAVRPAYRPCSMPIPFLVHSMQHAIISAVNCRMCRLRPPPSAAGA